LHRERQSEVIGVSPDFALSDTLWARVAAILATMDAAPPRNARALLNAIISRALTGTTWDELPPTYHRPVKSRPTPRAGGSWGCCNASNRSCCSGSARSHTVRPRRYGAAALATAGAS
jgi:hypothetical protein